MAITITPAEQQQKDWEKTFIREYIRDSGYREFMGPEPSNVIQTKKGNTIPGKSLTLSLASGLSGDGRSGTDEDLVGNEESLSTYSHQININERVHGVLISKEQAKYSAADQRALVGPLLKEWCMNETRNDISDALLMAASGKTLRAPLNTLHNEEASVAEKNSWLTDNSDRVLFGNAKTNLVAGDFAASLASIDSTNDKLTGARVSLMKRIAKTASPHIRPLRVKGKGREYFVLFTDTRGFRDVKEDLKNDNLAGRERNVNSNPVFQDGELIHDGVIICEIPELPVFAGTGASSIDVSPALLCGAQAIAAGWGQLPELTKRNESDYGRKIGRGIEEYIGISKVQRFRAGEPLVDHGMVSGFFAGVEDA
ncbi:MAG: DUF4043 family protein [Rhizobiales bacterium]|nr:DUF4043 family protein [Hyphomicrobiales bacterium]